MVPMQSNSMLNASLSYACFTIFFILTGLTTLASSMNLLVLRLATINAEEQVQEKLEAAEAKRQAVHLEGDVISPNARFLVTQEKPEQCDTISVCSCTCLDHKIWQGKKRSKNRKDINDKTKIPIIRKPNNTKVKRLVNYRQSDTDLFTSSTKERSDNEKTSKFCFKSCGASGSISGNLAQKENNKNNNNADTDDNNNSTTSASNVNQKTSKLKRFSI